MAGRTGKTAKWGLVVLVGAVQFDPHGVVRHGYSFGARRALKSRNGSPKSFEVKWLQGP
jgi:hypothetical protein